MKFLILLITVFSTMAWSQEETINMNDVNLKIGLSSNDKETEGTVNDKYHSAAENSMTGGTRATCPGCGDPSKREANTNAIADSVVVEEGKKADGQQ